jgi:hypothetical protein
MRLAERGSACELPLLADGACRRCSPGRRTTPGCCQGTVSDEHGCGSPRVTVTLTNEVTNRVLSATAGAYGNYFFSEG